MTNHPTVDKDVVKRLLAIADDISLPIGNENRLTLREAAEALHRATEPTPFERTERPPRDKETTMFPLQANSGGVGELVEALKECQREARIGASTVWKRVDTIATNALAKANGGVWELRAAPVAVSEAVVANLIEAVSGLLAVTDDPENDADPEESIFPFARAALAEALALTEPAAPMLDGATARTVLLKHLSKEGFGGSESERGYFARRDRLTIAAMLEFAALQANSGGVGDRAASKLAASIMAAIRSARFPKEYADEAHDEFEAITLTPMLEAALQANSGGVVDALESIVDDFETEYLLYGKIINSPPASFVSAYSTAKAALDKACPPNSGE